MAWKIQAQIGRTLLHFLRQQEVALAAVASAGLQVQAGSIGGCGDRQR